MLVDIIFRKLKFINDDTNRRNVRLECEKKFELDELCWRRGLILCLFLLVFLLQFITGPHGTYAQMQYANPQPMMPTAAPFPGEVTNNNNYYTVNC